MEKDDTKREYIQLYRVLEEMQEHLDEYREKYDKKRWKPFDEQDLSLQACLKRLTKNELSKIRTHLNIHGASALKKQALIELIAEQLPQQIIRLLKMFDLERFRILEQVCAQGDKGCYPENVDNFDYFVSRGLFFTGTLDNQKVLIVPEEVRRAIISSDHVLLQKELRRNQDWISLSKGLLYYYGVLNVYQILKMLETTLNTEVNLGDLFNILYEYHDYDGDSFDIKGSEVFDLLVMNTDLVRKEHASRPELPFRPFTKQEIIQAGSYGFMDRNYAYLAFVQFVTKEYNIDVEDADAFVEECVYHIRNSVDVTQIMKGITEQFEIEDEITLKGFMNHLVQLHNHTRQWVLKGYTPNELSAVGSEEYNHNNLVPFVRRRKVDRNASCPCGSGKKYKKCCGRN